MVIFIKVDLVNNDNQASSHPAPQTWTESKFYRNEVLM